MKDIRLISLGRCYDRRADMIKQFSERGIPYDLIEAVDGKDESQLTEVEVDRQAFKKIYGREVRVGEIGCYASHLRALCKITGCEHDYGIVMEDDVVITKSAHEIEHILLKLNGQKPPSPGDKWLAYPGNPLTWTGHRYASAEYGGDEMEINKAYPCNINNLLLRLRMPLLGTQCYIISVEFADYVLTHCTTMYRPIDELYRMLASDDRFQFFHFPKEAWVCAPNFQVPSEITA